jgi:hypothetical protein
LISRALSARYQAKNDHARTDLLEVKHVVTPYSLLVMWIIHQLSFPLCPCHCDHLNNPKIGRASGLVSLDDFFTKLWLTRPSLELASGFNEVVSPLSHCSTFSNFNRVSRMVV